MKRAVELFTFELPSRGSPMIEQAWQTRSESAESFISVAERHREMVHAAACSADGARTRDEATTSSIPRDAEFLGIQFSRGTFMPALPPGRPLDGALTLPRATKRSFWLDFGPVGASGA
jgi:hypothetical protein